METREEYKLALQREYQRWNELINELAEEKWGLVLEGYNWTLKDVLAHLMSWQQVSNARLSAGVLEEEPHYPKWLQGGDPDTESDELTNAYNAHIYETYRDLPRQVVIDAWRDGFLTVIKTMDDLSDEALFTVDAFPWLSGYALKDVLFGTVDHHNEHYDERIGKLMDDSSSI